MGKAPGKAPGEGSMGRILEKGAGCKVLSTTQGSPCRSQLPGFGELHCPADGPLAFFSPLGASAGNGPARARHGRLEPGPGRLPAGGGQPPVHPGGHRRSPATDQDHAPGDLKRHPVRGGGATTDQRSAAVGAQRQGGSGPTAGGHSPVRCRHRRAPGQLPLVPAGPRPTQLGVD